MKRPRLLLGFLGAALVWSSWTGLGHTADLNCHPEILYRGDTLTIDLPENHRDYEFTIMGTTDTTLSEQIISFVPMREDRFGPLIAPDEFAKMKQVKLLTTEARGSPLDLRKGSERSIATGPPELIFNRSARYQVTVAPPIDPDVDYEHLADCTIEYLDYPRPKTAKANEKLLFSTDVSLACTPRVLYRGDTLTVYLPADHAGFEFWIRDGDVWALSFEPTSKDKFAPLIAPADFAKMNQVKLVTTEVRGLPFHEWQKTRVSKPARPIFTHTGRYSVWIDPGPHEFDRPNLLAAYCDVHYFDYPRPKTNQTSPK